MDYITKNNNGFIVYQNSPRRKWFKDKKDAINYRDENKLSTDWFQHDISQEKIKSSWRSLTVKERKNLKLCKKKGIIVSVKYEQMILGEILFKQFSIRKYGFEKAVEKAQKLRR